jgi:hypothetical protein
MSEQENPEQTPPPLSWTSAQPAQPAEPPTQPAPAGAMPLPAYSQQVPPPPPPASPGFQIPYTPQPIPPQMPFSPGGPTAPYPPTGVYQPTPYGAPGGFQPSYQQTPANPFDSRGTTILVLGILGLLLCPLLGPVAWYMGNAVRNEANTAGYPEPGVGKAGRIIGIVGTVYMGLIVAFIAFVVVAAVATSSY